MIQANEHWQHPDNFNRDKGLRSSSWFPAISVVKHWGTQGTAHGKNEKLGHGKRGNESFLTRQ
jgi:hypothetical protein